MVNTITKGTPYKMLNRAVTAIRKGMNKQSKSTDDDALSTVSSDGSCAAGTSSMASGCSSNVSVPSSKSTGSLFMHSKSSNRKNKRSVEGLLFDYFFLSFAI